jgi:voltage-gated potassium channel
VSVGGREIGPSPRGRCTSRGWLCGGSAARKLNPKLHIVARAGSDQSAAKLEIAGTDRTLSPYAVGGRRLASLATQPLVVDFLDIVTRGEKGIEFRLEEFRVPEDSFIAD